MAKSSDLKAKMQPAPDETKLTARQAMRLSQLTGVDANNLQGRTIAELMHLDIQDKGRLVGRVLAEVLPGGVMPEVTSRVVTSDAAPNGLATVLDMQQVGTTRYFDAAGFPGRTVGLSSTALPGATQ